MFGFFTHSFISLIHPVHQDLSRASTYQAPAGHWIIAQGHRHGPALGLLIEKADGHQEGREGTWNLGELVVTGWGWEEARQASQRR